jgi:signal transduction histidine kinase
MKKPLRTLFLEDDPDDAEMVGAKLAGLVDLTVCNSASKLLAALKQQWDIVLVDQKLPGIDGTEAIRMVKKSQPETPVILVTGSIGDHEAAVAAMKAGASDYILKDRIERLRMAVEHAHENHKRILEKNLNQRLELLGELSAGLAHDINNILGVILSGIDMVRRRIVPQDERILDMMEGASKRGAEILQQMLAFARGNEGGAFHVVAAEFLMTEISQMLRGTFPVNVRVKVETAIGTAQVRCDAAQINAALLNLCINARDAMPNGGQLTITTQNVSLHSDAELGLDGKYVCVSVRDTGVGISDAALPLIFQPFFTTKPKGKGTGLGLSMVKSLIEAHGGGVTVQSDPHGSTFNIYLPVATAVDAQEFDGDGKLVLLVDDEPVLRTWMRLFMESANYRVVEAASGPEALSAFLKHEGIAVLVSDIGLPLMDGYELAKALRELEPALPVLFVTGLASGGRAHGPDTSLQKPFSSALLLEELRRILILNP